MYQNIPGSYGSCYSSCASPLEKAINYSSCSHSSCGSYSSSDQYSSPSQHNISYMQQNTSNLSENNPYSRQQSGQSSAGRLYNFGTGISYSLTPVKYEPKINKTNNKCMATYAFDPELFLKKSRPYSQFAGKAAEVQGFIEECFEKVLGKNFPPDILVRVLSQEGMKSAHQSFSGKYDSWHDSILGFAVNRNGKSFSEIFIRENALDVVLVTAGHEIGHVLTQQLDNKRDEEAKAFAFCIEWVKAIKEHNIAGLADSILIPEPARNNLHDAALSFVLTQIDNGKKAMQAFWGLANKRISAKNLRITAVD